MAGLTYYARQPYFKKTWQRVASGVAISLTLLAVGRYFQSLVDLRYSRYRGRTALYGDTTVRNGWTDIEAKDNVHN